MCIIFMVTLDYNYVRTQRGQPTSPTQTQFPSGILCFFFLSSLRHILYIYILNPGQDTESSSFDIFTMFDVEFSKARPALTLLSSVHVIAANFVTWLFQRGALQRERENSTYTFIPSLLLLLFFILTIPTITAVAVICHFYSSPKTFSSLLHSSDSKLRVRTRTGLSCYSVVHNCIM